jgi:fluoride exporter
MNPQLILAVAIGGAIGSGILFGIGFPRGTLIINVTGSFLIGVFVGLFATKWDLPQVARVFLTVGICGGCTTFSNFSLDAWYLIERGQTAASTAYILGSVVLSIAALVAALLLIRAPP